MARGPAARWTPEQDAALCAARTGDKPLSFHKLGKVLGLAPSTVHNRAIVLKLCDPSTETRKPAYQAKPKPASNGGMRRCLGHCGRQFRSPDVRLVQLCDGCKGGHANGLPDGWL